MGFSIMALVHVINNSVFKHFKKKKKKFNTGFPSYAIGFSASITWPKS